MEYKKLGRTGLKVSPLCLGTMNFGWENTGLDQADSHRVMDHALEVGINFFDTANVYGWRTGGEVGEGLTEQIIGHWFAQGGGRRDKVVLATKVYGDMAEWPNHSRLSARHIVQACDDSLRRLNTDFIDLYQFHHVDRETPWEEIWQAIETLVTAGKVLYVGSSNFAGWHIAQANEAASRRNFLGLISEQCRYNLTVRDVELEVLPACEAYGLGVLPWSPLAGGVLGGSIRDPEEGRRATDDIRSEVDRFRSQLEEYEEFCAELGEPPGVVALAWLLSNPVVTAPIIGPRTNEQIDASLRALEIELDDDARTTLDDIFPGPGNPAPEAWAW